MHVMGTGGIARIAEQTLTDPTEQCVGRFHILRHLKGDTIWQQQASMAPERIWRQKGALPGRFEKVEVSHARTGGGHGTAHRSNLVRPR
ncbi:hypothetical protein C1J03_23845 (plasmid) [Sulfitobacter sp. SK012]|nr:hypothetical protein C1J03_23845 [Sulfitobacter sp. SK012]